MLSSGVQLNSTITIVAKRIALGHDLAMHCDLCSGTTFKPIAERDRHGNPLKTVICLHCGLVSHMPIPSESEIAAYYAARYRLDYHGEVVPSSRRVLRAWKNGQRIYRLLHPYLSGDEHVFEVGAGIGCTVRTFRDHGFQADGIEPNRDFNRYGNRLLGLNVANANLFEWDAKQRYDLVLLVHVIEHFTSPSKALTKIREMLKPNGRLYVECPNLAAPFATPSRLFHFAHVYNFTPQTLAMLAARNGFAVERWLSQAKEPNIHVLLRVAPKVMILPPKGIAEQVEAAAFRYGTLRYYLRPSYLSRRIKKIFSYVNEWAFGPLFVRRLKA